ncbi:hypothetical protein [Bacillus pumilus]|uniref:hypothetical protein n=1 Tax=Bacillus pumilus TaxID=1408 RepID=UPI003B66C2C9
MRENAPVKWLASFIESASIIFLVMSDMDEEVKELAVVFMLIPTSQKEKHLNVS